MITLYIFLQERDGADNLLSAEKKQLLKIKRYLESQLRSVQKQLQVLDNARKRLKAVLSERNRVLDLICHAVTPTSRASKSKEKSQSENTGTLSFGQNYQKYILESYF